MFNASGPCPQRAAGATHCLHDVTPGFHTPYESYTKTERCCHCGAERAYLVMPVKFSGPLAQQPHGPFVPPARLTFGTEAPGA